MNPCLIHGATGAICLAFLISVTSAHIFSTLYVLRSSNVNSVIEYDFYYVLSWRDNDSAFDEGIWKSRDCSDIQHYLCESSKSHRQFAIAGTY